MRDDIVLLEQAMPVYDALYAWCKTARNETHSWPQKVATHVSPAPPISFGEALRVWSKIGWLSFGGRPDRSLSCIASWSSGRWISEARFLHALNYCMLLPGPEAQQLATYIGWLLHRTRGGIVAGGLFVLPGMLVMLV